MPEQKKAFGWGYVQQRKDGSRVVDHSGEVVSIGTLENATYGYVLESRKAGVMHTVDDSGNYVVTGAICECVCFTPEKRAAMEIPPEWQLNGTWLGIQFFHDPTWQRVKSGELRMLSFAGWAFPEPYRGA